MRKAVFFTLFFGIGLLVLNAQEALSNVVEGPKHGSLVIAGGGALPEEIVTKFISLAGGKDAAIVLVPTAAGLKEYDDGWKKLLTRYGATNVTILHTNVPKEANSSSFINPLKNATGVWFTGGRQWRLVDAYKGTKTEEAFQDVLSRGGVIGGSSAGATIQGSYLARGDTKNNQIMMGDHETGFGYLSNVAIDQHVLARNRQFDLFTILKKRPELLGIGLDEGTAIVVRHDKFEVIGASYVLVYDGSFWSAEGTSLKEVPDANQRFYFLKAGNQYDLKRRKVIR